MTRAVYLLLIVVGALALTLGVAACGRDQYGTYTVFKKHYSIDGHTYRCLMLRTDKGTGSLNCDWDHPLR